MQEVLVNRDYEPQAVARDKQVKALLHSAGIAFSDYKDQVLLDRSEVLTQQGHPYSVFTPYKRAWLPKAGRLPAQVLSRSALRTPPGCLTPIPTNIPTLEQLGFIATNLQSLPLPMGLRGARQLLANFLPRMTAYKEARDFPGRKGVSYLSVRLRLAPSRSANSLNWHTSKQSWVTKVRKLGCLSWHGVTFIS